MKYIVAATAILMLAGCDFETYRYACQNPDNWESAECQKPQCEVSRTCPEHIFKNQNNLVKAAAIEQVATKVPAPAANNKGGCK